MINKIKLNHILIAIMILSLIASLWTLYLRYYAEKPYKNIEITADFDEFNNLAEDANISTTALLKYLREAGVTSIGVSEITPELLEEKGLISLKKWYEVLSLYHNGNSYDFLESIIKNYDIKPNNVVIETKDKETFDFLYVSLEKRIDKNNIIFIANIQTTQNNQKPYLIIIKANFDDIKKMGLGFDEKLLSLIKESGLNIVARPINYNNITQEAVNQVIAQLNKFGIKEVIFNGKQVLGYDKYMNITAKEFKNNDIIVGLIETPVQRQHIPQAGMDKILSQTDYKAVRVYSMSKEEMQKLTPDEVVNRWQRAIVDRNIRIIYVKPYLDDNKAPLEDFKTNLDNFRRFSKLITYSGFQSGNIIPMKSFHPNKLLLLIIGIGVIGASLLILTNTTQMKNIYILILLIGGIILSVILEILNSTIYAQIMALLSAITFPILSMMYILSVSRNLLQNVNNKTNILLKSLLLFLYTISISLIGSSFVASLLSDIQFLLEINIFRGVKLAYTLPLIGFIGLYLIYFGYNKKYIPSKNNNILREFINTLEIDIKFKHILAISILLIIGYIYLGRSGNTSGIPVPGLEIKFRTLLEHTLVARPRTKEFLVAHPALFMLIITVLKGYKKFIFPLGFFAVMGQISIINSFSHLRTPLFISTLRTIYGLLFGILIGIILAILFMYFNEKYIKILDKTKK